MGQLRSVIDPFFLRREKATTLQPQLLGNASSDVLAAAPSALPSKAELIVWTRLSPSQLALYDGFLQTEEVRTVLNTSESPLAALTVLKKICCHPLLLNDRAREVTKIALLTRREELGLGDEESLDGLDCAPSEVSSLYHLSDIKLEEVLRQSGKLQCLFQLLESFQGDNLIQSHLLYFSGT
jgi:SNF2 family DNA or RNA helicase